MTSRPFADFPRNEQGLVDNFLGTAYDTVKRVSDNLPELQRLDGVLGEIEVVAETIATATIAEAMIPIRVELAATTAHVEGVAGSIQENLLVNATTQLLPAKGTESNVDPDEDTIMGFAGRNAYMSLTKIAFGPVLTAGANIVPMAAFVGSVVNPKNFTGFKFLVLRGGLPTAIDNLYDSTLDRVTVTGAVAGDRLIAVEQDVGGGDISKAPVTAEGVTKLLREWIVETKSLPDALAAPDGGEKVGWLRSPLASAINTVAYMLDAQIVNIWEFVSYITTKPTSDPGTWDWTPAFLAADAAIAGGGPIPLATDGFIQVPTGKFPVTSVQFSHRVSLMCAGGVIVPFNDVVRSHLLKFTGYSRIYNLSIDMNYVMNYDTAVWCHGRYIDFTNPEIWRAKCSYVFGDPAWENDPASGVLGDSEISICGGSTNHGITVARAYGQNTIVTFGGGHRAYSYKWTLLEGDPRKTAWEALPEYTFVNCGALIYLTGCFVGNFSAQYANFLSKIQAVSGDPAYLNSYGRFYVNGTHIETGLLLTCTPNGGVPIQDARTVLLQMSGCHGYMSVTPAYFIDSGNCAQSIDIRGCGFYGGNQDKIVYAVAAPVHVDEGSFTNRSVDFFQTLDVQYPKGYANFCALNSSSSAQVLSSTASNLKMPTLAQSDVSDDFQSLWYNPTTGVFTPRVAMRNVEISVNLFLTSGLQTDATDIMLYVNGALIDVMSSPGTAPRAVLRAHKLASGDTVEIRAAQYQSRTLDGSTINRLMITGNV